MKKLVCIAMILCMMCALTAYGEQSAALQTPREIIGLEAESSPEWVVTLAEEQDAHQLFVVAAYENTTAWISLH